MFLLKFNLNKVITGPATKFYRSKPEGLLKDARGNQITDHSILESLAEDFSGEHTDLRTVAGIFKTLKRLNSTKYKPRASMSVGTGKVRQSCEDDKGTIQRCGNWKRHQSNREDKGLPKQEKADRSA